MMSLRALLPVLVLAAPLLAGSALAAETAQHVLVLKSGRRIECASEPVVALGRVLYRTSDNVQHAVSADLVDLTASNARPAPPARVPAPVRVAAHPATPATRPGAAAGTATSRPAAHEITARRADGKEVKLADLKGKVVLLDFWATWCMPCVADMPHVKKIAERHAKDGFEIVGISLDHDRARLDAFVKQHGITWPQHFDGKGWGNAVAQQYGVNSIPKTFLLDRQGRIAKVGLRGASVDAAIVELLAEK